MKTYTVYILKCADESYYTGITSNIDNRVIEHQSGKHPESYTFSRRPLELKYVCGFQNVNDAIAHEKQIKGWSRKKKEAIIAGDWNELVRLSNLKNQEKD